MIIFVKPLAPDEKSEYYDDSKKLAHLFEIPEMLVPASLADFNSYTERMLVSGEISVGPTARALAEEILYPSPLDFETGESFVPFDYGRVVARMLAGCLWTRVE